MSDQIERWHGTEGGYTNHRCRCDRCRTTWARAVRDRQTRRAARPVPDHVHGTENGYGNYKCRCASCTSAWSAAGLARLHRRIARAASIHSETQENR